MIHTKKRVPGTLFLRNLVERRSLLFQLVRRDFEQRFVGSAVGWIWGLIHPLVLLLSWVFVFQILLQQKAPAGENSYALFVFAGMLPWLLFSETVQRSAPSLLDQANLITKTVFPAEIVPVSVFLSTLISHLLALALIVAAELWLKQISPFLLLLPLYMFAIGLFAVGIGWIVASLHVFLRDTAQMLSVVLTMWFWAAPIVLPGGVAAFGGSQLSRSGDRGGLRRDGIHRWRLVLPLHEARLCRRSVATFYSRDMMLSGGRGAIFSSCAYKAITGSEDAA